MEALARQQEQGILCKHSTILSLAGTSMMCMRANCMVMGMRADCMVMHVFSIFSYHTVALDVECMRSGLAISTCMLEE